MNRTDAVLREFAYNMREAIRADLLEELTSGKVQRAKPLSKTPPLASLAKGQKRSPEVLQKTVERLLAHIRRNPGQRIEMIASELATTTRELTLPIKKLVASKAITTKGEKRATRYSAK